MQELFVDKIPYFKFLSMNDKPWLHQLKIITATRAAVYKFLWIFISVQGRKNTNKEGEIPCAKNKYKASTTYQAH